MRPGNPCLGSWMVYGLGTENKNLPSFIVMYDWRGGPIGGAPNWSSGFMPAGYQGTAFRTGNTPIVDLTPPKSVDPHRQRAEIDFIQKLNEEHRKSRPGNSDLEARVASYELAFQMQTHAPEAVDISKETAATTQALRYRRKDYGLLRAPVSGRAPAGRARCSVRATIQWWRTSAGVVGCALRAR